ncbi:MAG: HEAT repeat domain-containing protein [Gemmataceae bacterium]|nr:HEAT repeat domain-containing protein [Gemmataceae bacterium]
MTRPRLAVLMTGLLLATSTGLALRTAAFGDGAPQKPGGDPAARLRVPDGFVVELVAAPPLVEHPLMAGFDELGRLFVAEAAGLNLDEKALLKELPNRLRLLEDTDGDGRFDKSTVFADRMTMPQGALWYRGALYAGSAPSLWRLVDSDGDGRADQRRELVTGFASTGNAADIHGPFLGPDGRLYWTHGRKGHTIPLPDGRVLAGKAACIYRCRPDGTEVEIVCGGGMDNPVEVDFMATGEPLATVNILVGRPSRIDAIIYCIEGGVYPYSESVLKEFKRSGDLLPAVGPLGWVAPSGLVRSRSATFGATYHDNFFSAQFNMRRIQRHPLERDGAAFKLRNEDFLVSADIDFHPTDVLEDADGSLLVVDTGGWFRRGCPTSQIAKPEITGAIYRVRRTGAVPLADPRGLKLDWDQRTPAMLVPLLDDPRFVVRDRAVDHLALQGQGAVPVLQEVLQRGPSVRARRNAVWALTRMNTPQAHAALCQALRDSDLSVRLAAAHAVGLDRVAAALPSLLTMAAKDEPAARRAAASALGRLKRPEAVPALLESLGTEKDRFLEHALVYALIEIADRQATLPGLSHPNPRVRRGALVALDQMDGGHLIREQVMPLLDTPDVALQKAVLSIIIAHPDWGREVAGLLRQWAARPDLDATRRDGLRDAVLAFAAIPEIQALVSQALRQANTPAPTRLLLIEVLSRTSLKKLPPVWVEALQRCLEDRDDQMVRQAIATVRAVGGTDFDTALGQLGRDQSRSAEVRVAAWGTVAPRAAEIRPEEVMFLRAQLAQEKPPLLRRAAAEALGNLWLDDQQLLELTPVVATSGPFELPHLLAAFERSRERTVAERLLAALGKAPGLESLSAEALRRTLAGYPEEARAAATPLLKRLEVDREQQQARLAELEPLLKSGDAQRGRTVFFSGRAACATCHLVKAEGGRIGPDLTKIGAIRSGRDLLEAIVFPSTSFVRGYEPYGVATRDGRLHTGTLARETVEAIFLYNSEGAEIRIARASIDELQQGRQSIMPQGLDTQLSREQLADLLAFLQALR